MNSRVFALFGPLTALVLAFLAVRSSAATPMTVDYTCPARPGVTIRDIGGNPRDWEWLQGIFGPVAIHETAICPRGAVYAVDTLSDYHDVSLRVTVLDGDGNRMPNVPVAFSGFDDEIDTPGACRPNAQVVYTNENGEATMVMGSGHSYMPPAAGPLAVWVMDSMSSDCVTGLGWVAYTFHQHLNVTFRTVCDYGCDWTFMPFAVRQWPAVPSPTPDGHWWPPRTPL